MKTESRTGSNMATAIQIGSMPLLSDVVFLLDSTTGI
jgi:hypothetical protein